MCGEMRADSWFGKNSTYANDGIAYDKAFNKLVIENATEEVGLGTQSNASKGWTFYDKQGVAKKALDKDWKKYVNITK